jgi:hypothetical protein
MMNIHPSEGYTFTRADGVCGSEVHLFAGEKLYDGGICPNCNKPLLLLLRINTRDEKVCISSDRLAEVPILFCWTCDVSQGMFSYKVLGKGEISVVEFQHGEIQSDFPYDNYPVFFPETPIVLEPVSPEEEQVLSKYHAGELDTSDLPDTLDRPRHQIGGQPFCYSDDDVHCPVCGEIIPLLGVLGDDTYSPVGFVDNAFVQTLFHFCRTCDVVVMYQLCD